MKSAKKWGMYLAIGVFAGMLPIVVIIAAIMGIAGATGATGSDVKNILTDSAYNPEHFKELMRLADIGVPSDIIMMITTIQSENGEYTQENPFMANALEFMVMTEVISEKKHTCSDSDGDEEEDGDGDAGIETFSAEGEDDCEFEVVETNLYHYKNLILLYLGTPDNPDADLNTENLVERLQAKADGKAAVRGVESIISIQINAIRDTLYIDAIRRCGMNSEISAIIELHESGYYIEWFKERAADLGIELSEGILTGGINGVHSNIMKAIAGDTSPFVDEAFGDPVSGWRGTVSCEFGGYVGHTGIDFAVPIGTPVYASISGTVIITGSGTGGYGNYVAINHGGGIVTLYAHNSSLAVFNGQEVEKGQIIAYSGNSGNVRPKPTPENPTAGAHLHFEVVVSGIPKNPRGYLQ